MLVHKYVDQKRGVIAMLYIKRSAGVAPEVNLRNPLHAGQEAHTWGHLDIYALKPRADIARNSKQGYQWPQKQ